MRFLYIILTGLSISSFAQISMGGNISEKIYFGGGLGFNMGSSNGYNFTYIGLTPLVGYRITPKTSVGTGLTYNYYRFSSTIQKSSSLSLHQYGVSPFVRHQVMDNLFLYSEISFINTPSLDNSARRTYTRGLLGAGYSQTLGQNGRGVLNAMLLYDVLYKVSDRAFPSPWVFRIFFTY